MVNVPVRHVCEGVVCLNQSASAHFNCMMQQLRKNRDHSMHDIVRIEVNKNSLSFYFYHMNPEKPNHGGYSIKKEYTHTFGEKDFKMFTYKRDFETFASIHQIRTVANYWETAQTFLFSFIKTHDPLLNFNPVCMTCTCGNYSK